MARTIFERYGGFAKVSRVVGAFYTRVLDSDVLAPHFADVDMRRLMDHQTRFMAFVMGGPASYTSEHLARVHAHLPITDAEFDELIALVRETLEDFDFDETDIATIHGTIAAYRPVIVSGPPAATTAALRGSEPR